jgi:hypothetical protein
VRRRIAACVAIGVAANRTKKSEEIPHPAQLKEVKPAG